MFLLCCFFKCICEALIDVVADFVNDSMWVVFESFYQTVKLDILYIGSLFVL